MGVGRYDVCKVCVCLLEERIEALQKVIAEETAMTFCIYDIVSYGSQTNTTAIITVGIPVIASQGRNFPDLKRALSIM